MRHKTKIIFEIFWSNIEEKKMIILEEFHMFLSDVFIRKNGFTASLIPGDCVRIEKSEEENEYEVTFLHDEEVMRNHLRNRETILIEIPKDKTMRDFLFALGEKMNLEFDIIEETPTLLITIIARRSKKLEGGG